MTDQEAYDCLIAYLSQQWLPKEVKVAYDQIAERKVFDEQAMLNARIVELVKRLDPVAAYF